MVQVRRAKPQDLMYIFQNAELLGFKLSEMSNNLDNMVVVIDNHVICGLGFYLIKENKCLVNWLFIEEKFRREKLGTMLVKAMLSSAELQGAKEAYIIGSCTDFFDFLGFKEMEEEDCKNITALYKEAYGTIVNSNIYQVSLLDYFKPCSENRYGK